MKNNFNIVVIVVVRYQVVKSITKSSDPESFQDPLSRTFQKE